MVSWRFANVSITKKSICCYKILIRSSYDGKEVITQFTVKDFYNKGVFYTDSNGREQIKRELNKRSDYEYDSNDEPVSSNYYPVTSKIVIKNIEQNLEVAVLNDRAQGGSSSSDGGIELMVHRKLVHDDGFGVGEALRETEYGRGLYARGQHFLVFGPANNNIENGTIIFLVLLLHLF